MGLLLIDATIVQNAVASASAASAFNFKWLPGSLGGFEKIWLIIKKRIVFSTKSYLLFPSIEFLIVIRNKGFQMINNSNTTNGWLLTEEMQIQKVGKEYTVGKLE